MHKQLHIAYLINLGPHPNIVNGKQYDVNKVVVQIFQKKNILTRRLKSLSFLTALNNKPS